jgi:hypothetical protein
MMQPLVNSGQLTTDYGQIIDTGGGKRLCSIEGFSPLARCRPA